MAMVYYNLENVGGSFDLVIALVAAIIKSSLCNIDIFQVAMKFRLSDTE